MEGQNRIAPCSNDKASVATRPAQRVPEQHGATVSLQKMQVIDVTTERLSASLTRCHSRQ
jgi:hypothetical protein